MLDVPEEPEYTPAPGEPPVEGDGSGNNNVAPDPVNDPEPQQ
jgi:hypothetical protein